MLTGDGGTIQLNGRTIGHIRSWAMTAGGGVRIKAQITIPPLYVRLTPKQLIIAPTRSNSKSYTLRFVGDVTELTATSLTLDHCQEVP